MSKPPIPLIVQRALSMDLLEHAHPIVSSALTFLFETYFRVSGDLATTADSVIPAAPSMAGTSQSVAILALPSEMETTDKTGETDLSVLLDLPRQKKLGLVLELLAATKKNEERLLPILRSPAEIQLRGGWRQAASTKRYEKTARLNKQLALIPAAVKDRVYQMAQAYDERFVELYTMPLQLLPQAASSSKSLQDLSGSLKR